MKKYNKQELEYYGLFEQKLYDQDAYEQKIDEQDLDKQLIPYNHDLMEQEIEEETRFDKSAEIDVINTEAITIIEQNLMI